MQIEYQNAVAGALPPASDWLPGDLEPIPTGSYSVKKPNGRYLLITERGELTDTDTIGPLTAFVPDPQLNVLRVGYGTEQGPRFALWFRYA